VHVNRVVVPGKAMLFGEYAVLVGGSAVLYPVPRYLVITEQTDQTNIDYTPVIRAALKLPIPEIADFESKNGPANPECDNRQFFVPDVAGTPCKLGLGLSAAEAVGIIALRFNRAGYDTENCRDKIAAYAHRAHGLAQNGRGSGADVYCCAYEAPLKYGIVNGLPRAELLTENRAGRAFPMHLVYTGKPADSRRAIDSFNIWCRNMTTEGRYRLSQLVQISDNLAAKWAKDQYDDIIPLLDKFCTTMKWISGMAGLDYWNDFHADLDNWARKHGGRAKPIGAGGGDMVLLLGYVPMEEICPRPYDYCIKITRGFPEETNYPLGDKLSSKTR